MKLKMTGVAAPREEAPSEKVLIRRSALCPFRSRVCGPPAPVLEVP